MPSAISGYVDQIRHAIYGREVRESIASGIEECYKNVTDGVTYVEGAVNGLTAGATGGNAGTSPSVVVSTAGSGSSEHLHLQFTIPKGDTGDAFSIKKTFESVSAMNSYSGSDVVEGDFVMITVPEVNGGVEAADNGKLYIKGASGYRFITDMSGVQGIKGDTGATPALTIGTVTTVAPNVDASATLTGTAENPVLNLNIPRGVTGNESIDDSASIGDVDVVWSADKTAKELESKSSVESMSRSKTMTGNPIVITDAVAEVADKLVIRLDPKQDLHGYSKPWVGGAGKNKLQMTVASLKAANTSGTWSGNTYTYRSVTYTVNTDTDGNVLSIKVNGTADGGNSDFAIYVSTTDISALVGMKLNGSTGGSTSTYGIAIEAVGIVQYNGEDYTIPQNYSDKQSIYFRVASGKSASNVLIYPMVRASTETNATFEPYTNHCAITGYDAVNPAVYHKNQIVKTEIGSINSSTGIDETGRTDMIKTGFIPVKVNTNYMFSIDAATKPSNSVRMFRYDKDKNMLGTMVFTPNYLFNFAEGSAYVRFQHSESNYPLDTLMQFEEGSVATAIEPYGKTYPISLSTASRTVSGTTTTAGTVFGGELTLNRDGSGTIAVDNVRKICTGVDEAWNINSGTGGTTYFVHQVGAINTVVADYAVCDSFPQASISSSTTNIGITMANSSARNGAYVFVRPNNADSYASADAFKEFLQAHNITIVYKLTTPVTYSLTAQQVQTLLGYNYIYADNGTMELTYRQETLATNDTLLGLLPTGTATGNPITISDGAKNVPLKKLKINIEPWQDLHGYTKPWVGGAGKNLVNFDGSAKSNATIFEMMYDEAGNFAGVKGTGTPTGSAYLGTLFTLPAGEYILSGAPAGSGQSITSVSVRLGGLNGNNVATSYGTDVTFTAQEGVTYCLCCLAASGINTTGKIWKPMIRKASVSDATWEPYKNLCPIRGWDAVNVPRVGKNLFDGKKIDGYISDEGVIGTDGYGVHSDFIPVTEGASYTYSCVSNISSTINRRIHAYDANKNWKQMINKNSTSGAGSKSATFTVPSGARYIVVQFYGGASANAASMDTNIQVEQGSSATTYEAPAVRTYTIDLPSEAGTVYGGSLILDEYGEGTLVVDRRKSTITTLNTIQTSSTGTGKFVACENISGGYYSASDVNVICENIKGVSYNNRGQAWEGYINSSGNFVVFLPSDETQEEAAAVLVGSSVVFKLATPLTYHLTANQLKTLLGSNTIWCDSGNVEIEYFKDMAGAIQDATSQKKIITINLVGFQISESNNTKSAPEVTANHKPVSLVITSNDSEIEHVTVTTGDGTITVKTTDSGVSEFVNGVLTLALPDQSYTFSDEIPEEVEEG